jgi:putative MFS transporter
MRKASLFSNPGHALAFWAGCAAVTAGVLLHIPMFLMGRKTHYHLAGMPMGTGMLIGMGLIVAGFAATAWGLLPRRNAAGPGVTEDMAPPEDAPLTRAHWIQISVLAVALVIDVMKAASLGFVTPGMRVEYGLSFAAVAVLPFVALLGTTVGSFTWGALADIYGRRATILLAAVIFMGTSICGAMPSFAWNIFMCFLMGVGAGGMLPVAYALLAEIMPTGHRGWCLVLVGGIGSIGGYFATSLLSEWLQPYFGSSTCPSRSSWSPSAPFFRNRPAFCKAWAACARRVKPSPASATRPTPLLRPLFRIRQPLARSSRAA